MSRKRDRNNVMNFINAIPLFAVILVIYNLVIFSGDRTILDAELMNIKLISGGVWQITSKDILLSIGLITLYVEILKATRSNLVSIVNHSLSILVFVLFLVEFIVIAEAGNSTFFLLGLMSLMDAIAGFAITIVASRRDFYTPD